MPTSFVEDPTAAEQSARARRTAVIEATDYFRRSSRGFGGPGSHKEWQHFLVHTTGLHLLINFSILDNVFGGGEEVGRVIVMARGAKGWQGDVVRAAPSELRVRAGEISAHFGNNAMTFADGLYKVHVQLADPPLSADLEFSPLSLAAFCPNQPLSRQESLSWLFVPRLVASGTVELEGTTYQLNGAPAYHDHNWGSFRWGDDFTWEWSSILPEDAQSPWSAVYMRLTDRRRLEARCQGLYIWHGETDKRIFRDHEIDVELSGCFRKASFLRLPRVMSLLSSGCANDVPRELVVRARAEGDTVTLHFRPDDLCQVVVPSETNPRAVVTLNEVVGRASLEGQIAGEHINLEGPSVFEFVRG
jgi:hypothetical protein